MARSITLSTKGLPHAPTLTIRKELHLPAPDPHIAVYAQKPVYTSPEGRTLIEAVKEEARTGSGRYCDRRIYRRRGAIRGGRLTLREGASKIASYGNL